MTDTQAKIERHGRNLLAIFPDAAEQDPVKLCKKLRRLEAQAAALALRGCNGPEWGSEEEQWAAYTRILVKVQSLLGYHTAAGTSPVFINRDPRGYQLKIRPEGIEGKLIERDWGGYGIIAPEIK